ncbi:MAG: hypothetical protein HYY10_03415 [Candidatus Liptonbacteria bacterium]|nr:hypothetical protein [Candidatus Liptonbacteria bacterium]
MQWKRGLRWAREKLTKSDKSLIAFTSFLIALLTFLSALGWEYKLYAGTPPDIWSTRFFGFILTIPLYIISPVYLLIKSEGTALGAGILITFLSPVISFIFWFVSFYLLTNLVKHTFGTSKFLARNSITITFLIFITLSATAFIIKGVPIYQADRTPVVLKSITPLTAPIGATVTIIGSGFSNHRLIIWLRNKTTKEEGSLWEGKSTIDGTLTLQIKERLCSVAFEEIGLKESECRSFIEIRPGKYEVEARFVTDFSGLEITPSLAFEVEP